MYIRIQAPKFFVGTILMSFATRKALSPSLITSLLARHINGDSGYADARTRAMNSDALRRKGRVVSKYPVPSGQSVLVLTDIGQNETVILLEE